MRYPYENLPLIPQGDEERKFLDLLNEAVQEGKFKELYL